MDVLVWTRPSSKGGANATKSRLASRETGDGLTVTDSGGSLDRATSKTTWSQERYDRPDRREAPEKDKAVSSLSLTHLPCPEM